MKNASNKYGRNQKSHPWGERSPGETHTIITTQQSSIHASTKKRLTRSSRPGSEHLEAPGGTTSTQTSTEPGPPQLLGVKHGDLRESKQSSIHASTTKLTDNNHQSMRQATTTTRFGPNESRKNCASSWHHQLQYYIIVLPPASIADADCPRWAASSVQADVEDVSKCHQ